MHESPYYVGFLNMRDLGAGKEPTLRGDTRRIMGCTHTRQLGRGVEIVGKIGDRQLSTAAAGDRSEPLDRSE